MFLRVETGLKADFKDPEAERWLQQISKVHRTLAEKIRWIRLLDVYWIELDAPRDRVVQSLQHAFRDSVLNWIFTGDLLPSAGGPSGTLQDLMQSAPMRPGVFHGIEKRKRIHIHDEKSQVALEMLQTILGKSAPADKLNDKLVTGELLLLEGPKLVQSDLEWISRFLFTNEKFESWTFIAEDELRKNSRFQPEQVAKYLNPKTAQVSSAKWMQYRQQTRKKEEGPNWEQLTHAFMRKDPFYSFETELAEEEWTLFPKIEFSTLDLNKNTQNETEFALLKSQLEMNIENCSPRLQTVLSVLPKKDRLWFGSEHGFHPERIWSEYFQALKRVAETSSTPVVQTRLFEDELENNPSFFWTSTVGVRDVASKNSSPEDFVEFFWIGYEDPPLASGTVTNLIFVEKLKELKTRCEQAEALTFSMSTSGRTLPWVLQFTQSHLKYGFDLVIDGHHDWFANSLTQPFSLSQMWGVRANQKAWVVQQLKQRGIPFIQIGISTLTGSIRVIEAGQVKIETKIGEFFQERPKFSELDLLEEPFYVQDPLKRLNCSSQRFSAEELLIKNSPVVFRPKSGVWSGLMVHSDLFEVSLKRTDLEWMLRKCTAMGGQVHSIQVSMVNGLRFWNKIIRQLCSEFGIQLSQLEVRNEPQLQAHWCAVQFVSTINDVRNVRSEDVKSPNERIYWLDGRFDQPAFRWFAGMEGRYQAGLSSAVPVELNGLTETLVKILMKRKLGADIALLSMNYDEGFVVTLSENERFTIEEEWKTMGIEFHFLGKVVQAPYLMIREENKPAQTISIEDLKSIREQSQTGGDHEHPL